jgi:Ala-tRNA(Pro) deacylase
MATATWIKDMLEEQGVAYKECHHDLAYTAQSVAEREHVSGHHVAKVVVVIADGRPVELVLPASRRVLLESVRGILGAKNIRLATEDELDYYFEDCELGAMPALRHWDDIDVVMDSSMKVDGDILFQAGTHYDAVRMRFDDWMALVKPPIASFTENIRPANRLADAEQRWEWEGGHLP